MIIAIDGPAGAGKSTIAKEIAQKLGWVYIDTGAMYRAVALCILSQGIDLTDTNTITAALANIQIKISHINKNQHIFLNKEDVTNKIRTSEISNAASTIAAISAVRDNLVQLQRTLAHTTNVVMDGRDIGSVVFPNADLKIFLTASLAERTNRRFKEQTENGKIVEWNKIFSEIELRDKADCSRVDSPLIQAEDAILVDTSNLTADMVVDHILQLAKDKVGVQFD
ncbi:(d)CMP kinase [Candidatus Epulonipiscium viviparus]|uniref:(d)CMP kinase n=1 Tax=Candidatus Epulonipiscium viviparus TaxID=420336 RepID=UPI0004965082|nr:(d)CMP kinase [Candidatus Epulopiscium viviparus]